jgi:hypothetical protein
MHKQYLQKRLVMSLNSVQNPVTTRHFAAPLINEMQREDFLALAAALRQFNAYESDVVMAIESARYVDQAE